MVHVTTAKTDWPLQARRHGSPSTLPLLVTVIEAGALEKQVCLLVESLRRWGGRLADAPVVAVKPRFGPGISRVTQQALSRLGAEYLEIKRDDAYQWFAYLNKTAALRHIAARHSGPIVWLDGDVLVLDEPHELIFDESSHWAFAACASDKNIGTSRDDDEFAPYFRAACQTVGVDFTSLPYILTERERISIRTYWNSGVYAFVGKSGLADVHHRFSTTLLAKGIASHESGLFFTDQVGLGLAAHHLGLTPKSLPLSHNFSVQPDVADTCIREAGKNICILHYHGCLWPTSFDTLCNGLEVNYLEAARWLRKHGPLMVDVSIGARIVRKVLDLHRKRQYSSALQRARIY